MSIIRKAIRQDLPRILELYEELTEEKQDISPDTLDRVFNQINSMPGYEFLVAEKDGVILGTLYFQIVPNLTHNARPWAFVENVVVDSRYRREGIGRLLMDYVISRARQAGCHKVQLHSSKKRQEAHQFYRSLGFDDSAMGFRLYLHQGEG
jgi:ribosomal protein S18 acetylase RimI-like enzyme